MKKILRWLSAVCIVAVLAACGGGGGGGSDGIAPVKAKSTLMVYFVVSDMLPYSERDLLNMLAAKNSSDVNIVVQIGGGSGPGSFAGVDFRETKRYHLVPTPGSTQGWTLEPLPAAQQPGQVALNNPQTLRDFIQWSASAFPAQQYSIALWDHGGGPLVGFGQDYAMGGGGLLSLADMSSAFKQAGVKFELIGFDACLMASLEIASAFAPYSNFLVASEELTTGWDWKDVVSSMANNPLANGAELGKAIVESYKVFSNAGDPDETQLEFSAYGVSDLTQVGALITVLDKAALVMQQDIKARGLQSWVAIATARRKALDFQSNLFLVESDLVDVNSWIHELGNAEVLPQALVNEFDQAFKKVVVHVDGGEDKATGLMMYFPRYSTLNTDLLATYQKLDFSPTFKGLVGTYTDFAASDQMPRVSVGETQVSAGVVTADISVSYTSLLRAAPVLDRPFDGSYAVLVKDGIAHAMQPVEAQGNQLRMSTPNRWPTVNGQLVTLLPQDPDDKVTYLIPIASADGAKQGVLIAVRNADQQLEIRWSAESDRLAGATALDLIEPGEDFYPMVWDIASDTFVPGKVPMIAPNGAWTVQMSNTAAAGYQLHLAASDLTGVTRTSAVGVTLPLGP